MSLAVPKVSRRRTDQLRNFVRVLELGAIDLDAGVRIAEQGLGHGFHHARLARPGVPQKQQVPYAAPRRVQAGQKHLINLGDLFDSLVLPNNAAAQGGFKFSRIGAAAVRIEHSSKIRSHSFPFSFLSQAVFPGPLPAFPPTSPAFLPRDSCRSRLTDFVTWNRRFA